jgi:hypothetical protein
LIKKIFTTLCKEIKKGEQKPELKLLHIAGAAAVVMVDVVVDFVAVVVVVNDDDDAVVVVYDDFVVDVDFFHKKVYAWVISYALAYEISHPAHEILTQAKKTKKQSYKTSHIEVIEKLKKKKGTCMCPDNRSCL